MKLTRTSVANPSLAPHKDSKPDVWWLDASKTRYSAHLCACDDCRLAFGVEFVAFINPPTFNIKLINGSDFTGYDNFGTLKSYRHSDCATRYFCGDCSASVFWVADDEQNVPDIAVGLLDATSGVLAEDWLDWNNDVSYVKDGSKRGQLTEALQAGVQEWKSKKKQV